MKSKNLTEKLNYEEMYQKIEHLSSCLYSTRDHKITISVSEEESMIFLRNSYIHNIQNYTKEEREIISEKLNQIDKLSSDLWKYDLYIKKTQK